ncbi:hypothetical protein TNCV_2685231 [Trichonephila clavipes]|nr:hypothetical protein TNCV_2685231 [Trichonephila clavipes]
MVTLKSSTKTIGDGLRSSEPRTSARTIPEQPSALQTPTPRQCEDFKPLTGTSVSQLRVSNSGVTKNMRTQVLGFKPKYALCVSQALGQPPPHLRLAGVYVSPLVHNPMTAGTAMTADRLTQ